MSLQGLPYYLPVLIVTPIVLHGTIAPDLRAQLGRCLLNVLARTLITVSFLGVCAVLISTQFSPVLALLPWFALLLALFPLGALLGGLSMPKEAV